jgi:hypothetical protein
MSQVKITLIIDIPDGLVPDVQYADVGPEPEYVNAPLPQYDADVIVRPVAVPAPACPQHGAMTRFPAGTNKAGKPYNASWRCSTRDCPTKAIWDRDA